MNGSLSPHTDRGCPPELQRHEDIAIVQLPSKPVFHARSEAKPAVESGIASTTINATPPSPQADRPSLTRWLPMAGRCNAGRTASGARPSPPGALARPCNATRLNTMCPTTRSCALTTGEITTSQRAGPDARPGSSGRSRRMDALVRRRTNHSDTCRHQPAQWQIERPAGRECRPAPVGPGMSLLRPARAGASSLDQTGITPSLLSRRACPASCG